jgi:erythromycin esterase
MLDSIFKNVRVFGFGEATHGTKEFFDIKIKFLKYLVKNQGVRNFAIEASYGNCVAINNYIKGGNQNLRELLANMRLWTYNTEEISSLIVWMKAYNSDKMQSDQLNFYGIDIMDCSNSAKMISEFIKQLQYVDVVKFLEILNYYASQNNSIILKEKILIDNMNIMIKLKEVIENSTLEEKDFYVTLQNSIVQYINFRINYSQETRDKEMSENVNQILVSSGGDSKIFIWAHNFHVKKNKIDYSNKSMGYFLKQKYGNEYYSVGFDFATGTFNAYNIKSNKVEKYYINETLKNTSSELLNESKFGSFFLDFKVVNEVRAINDYINSKVNYREIGSAYSPKMINREKLNDAYDGLIFVKETTASALLHK